MEVNSDVGLAGRPGQAVAGGRPTTSSRSNPRRADECVRRRGFFRVMRDTRQPVATEHVGVFKLIRGAISAMVGRFRASAGCVDDWSMSASGPKRTCSAQNATSAPDPKLKSRPSRATARIIPFRLSRRLGSSRRLCTTLANDDERRPHGGMSSPGIDGTIQEREHGAPKCF